MKSSTRPPNCWHRPWTTSGCPCGRSRARSGSTPSPCTCTFEPNRNFLLAVVERFFAELQRHIEKAKAVHADSKSRLRAHCLAYCDYGLSSPGHYKLLFESRLTGQLGIGFQGSPGARVFDDFIDTVRQCAAPRAPRQKVMQDAVILWAGLHGIVSLRWSKPGVPWPPVEALARPLA